MGHGGATPGAPVSVAQWTQRWSLPSPGTPMSSERGAEGPSLSGVKVLGGAGISEGWRAPRGAVGGCPTTGGSSSRGTDGGLLPSTWELTREQSCCQTSCFLPFF